MTFRTPHAFNTLYEGGAGGRGGTGNDSASGTLGQGGRGGQGGEAMINHQDENLRMSIDEFEGEEGFHCQFGVSRAY